MNESDVSGRRWRIGELAAATGLTVRTLHHYEHVGLLAPSDRSEGGHRLYDAGDVQRLYRIRVLRSLGLSLEDVGRALDRGAALPDVLQEHLARVEVELARINRLRDRLRGIAEHAGSEIKVEELLDTIDAMSRLDRHVRARQQERRPDVEPEWRRLGGELRGCMQAGVDPAAERPQALAARARSLLEDFAGDDPAVLDAMAKIRAVDPPRGLAGWDPELTRYLDRALAALEEED